MTDINEIKRELEALTAKVAAYEATKARNWPERIEAGTAFQHRGGAVYMWTHDRCQDLVCVVAGGKSRCGDVFDKDLARACMDSFTYLGHARDILTIRTDAHEPTGADLVGVLEDIRCVSNNPGQTLTTLGLTECLQSCNVMARKALEELAK